MIHSLLPRHVAVVGLAVALSLPSILIAQAGAAQSPAQQVLQARQEYKDKLEPTDSPERQASSDEDAKAKGLGIYSTDDVEAVITAQVAATAGVELGTRLSIGDRPENHVVVNIVGIVAPVNPDDPIWQDNDLALTGEITQQGVGAKHYNKHDYINEKRHALGRWESLLGTILEGGGVVVALGERRAAS